MRLFLFVLLLALSICFPVLALIDTKPLVPLLDLLMLWMFWFEDFFYSTSHKGY